VRFRLSFLLLFSLLFSGYPLSATAQPDTTLHIRFSLLTCGPGKEIYSVFGHTAIRIVDSSTGSDWVYNYGTFDGYEENFELKFMRGKLLYYLSREQFLEFMDLYAEDGRLVQEQELLLSNAEKEHIYAAIRENFRPENRAYKYDFFFDNCATRIRDIIPKGLGTGFQYPNVLPGSSVSFRTIINHYLYRDHWTRLGINILLGAKVDKPMSNSDIMFLPDYLRDGVGGATLNGRKIATPAATLLEGQPLPAAKANGAFWVLLAFAVLTIACGLLPGTQRIGLMLQGITLAVSGLLGILILFMWFGTDHQACGPNFNLLWALPTNLAVPFIQKTRRYVYAYIGLFALLLAALLHMTGIQRLPLPELAPVLAILVFIFGTIVRKHKKGFYNGKAQPGK